MEPAETAAELCEQLRELGLSALAEMVETLSNERDAALAVASPTPRNEASLAGLYDELQALDLGATAEVIRRLVADRDAALKAARAAIMRQCLGRDQLARLIDPDAFAFADHGRPSAQTHPAGPGRGARRQGLRERALVRADALLLALEQGS